ncbi:hypothetical protein [uncultured Hymenobacter sp.]|uniref:hypothetical protein n=1 Tax=uncultured Hymenobacter sp. TaxID=170016 RepID=UPI0035CC7AC9
MIKFIRSLFSKPRSSESLPLDYPSYIRNAVTVVTNTNGQLEDEELINLFVENGIPRNEATELLLFLPTAFCRHLLPLVDWPTYYCEQTASNKNIKIEYADNPRFVAIQNVTAETYASVFEQGNVVKIAGRSASFKAINNLLNDGGRLEDVAVSPEYVIR